MNFIPRCFAAVCVATLTATLFAAPSPKWVPANADFVVVGDGLDRQDAAADKVWRDGLTKAGLSTSSPLETIKEIDAACPGVSTVLKTLLGASDDFSSVTTKSTVSALYVDKEDVAQDTFNNSYLIVAIENPKADLKALEEAIHKMLETAKEEPPFVLAREDVWLTFRPKAKDASKATASVVGAITQIPEGYLFTVQSTLDRANALLKGEVKSIEADNPLMKAFAPIPADTRQTVIYVLKDVSALLKRFMKPEQLKQTNTVYPPALQTKDVVITSTTRGTTTEISIKINTTTPAAAQQTMEAFLGYKVLAQMVGAGAIGKQDSKLIGLLSTITSKTEGNAAVISCSLTPELLLPVIAEIKELEAKSNATFDDDAMADDIDSLLEDDEEDDTTMTAEEAQAILDALDVE